MCAITTVEKEIEEIIKNAKNDPVKGRYYVYERYKSQLVDTCETSIQLERACIELARVLKV